MRESRPWMLAAAVLLSIAHLAMIWGFRYLPLYDYPIWLFEIKVLHALSAGSELYSRAFTIASGPMPNLAFLGIGWIFTYLTDPETAGKCLLSVCVVGLPWSWWWATRRIAGGETPWAFLGFPFALNLFFWGRNGYLLALVAFIITLGFCWTGAGKMRILSSVGVSCITLCLFFLHGAVFVVWCMVVATVLLKDGKPVRQRIVRLLAVFLPALVLTLWYLMKAAPPMVAEGSFGLHSIAWGVGKPLLLFIKTYGILSPAPVTALNLVWLAILVYSVVSFVRVPGMAIAPHRRWHPATVLIIVLAILLPDDFMGIVQPGSYFILPALFLVVTGIPHKGSTAMVPVLLLAAAVCVSAYSFEHVRRVNLQMSEFTADFQSAVDVSQPHVVLGFDWPAGTGAGDVLSASVNPLFGVQYYALLEKEGLATIHETSLLRLRESSSWLRPPFTGSTRDKFRQSVMKNLPWCRRFSSIVVTGRNDDAAAVVTSLQGSGYRLVCQKAFWTILAYSEDTK